MKQNTKSSIEKMQCNTKLTMKVFCASFFNEKVTSHLSTPKQVKRSCFDCKDLTQIPIEINTVNEIAKFAPKQAKLFCFESIKIIITSYRKTPLLSTGF